MGSSQSAPSAGVRVEGNTSDAPSSTTTGDKSNKSAAPENKDDEYTNPSYPIPKGDEYDKINKLLDMMPTFIDDESKAEVDAYTKECNDGAGPVVACFSTAEYISLMQRDYDKVIQLYENTCFRPASDKSPNTVTMPDGTKSYPPACFNLARFRLTGKGRTKFSQKDGYDLFDRACVANHHGACHMQARMLSSSPGSFGDEVPYDPVKALDLFEHACRDGADNASCFTAATVLLRGEFVKPEADNVSPGEAKGTEDIQIREGEIDRRRNVKDKRVAIKRDPPRAESMLELACNRGHPSSCFNLAVMYNVGDDGVPKNSEKYAAYQKKTEEQIETFGGFGFGGGPTSG
eukprot:CAMPEP_0194366358 /NCGR_PEP_ID=MMETSP0174-20130528/14389_1 /TAXON_ID=216777 /ORGANISM="Proboscia alata, Strain PI-D3" /LENGTH=346 /DNA_ID=CAMNT_0039141497 /DNA_START=241 /DNA_END=1281 /DNA_ORIENTATION=+